MNQVLLIAPNDELRRQCQNVFRSHGLTVRVAASPAEAEEYLNRFPIDWVVLSESLQTQPPGWIQSLSSRPRKPLLLILTENAESALTAMRQGASDALPHPITDLNLHLAVERAGRLQRLTRTVALMGQGLANAEESINPWMNAGDTMQHLGLSIRKLARTEATILIQGPAGSGKSTVARALHAQSHRSHAAFISLDCANVSPDQISHRLFGSEQEDAEGNRAQITGLIDLAQGGTLYLDEISRLPDDGQARLESLLQDRQFTRVNGSQAIPCDVRLLASTRPSLEKALQAGRFHEGLYILLNILPLSIPPLRDRPEDITHLAEQLRQRLARQYGLENAGFSTAALAALRRHSWPGNIAELESVIARGLLSVAGTKLLEPSDLFPNMITSPSTAPARTETAEEIENLAALEKRHILAVLEKCGGNRTHAARRLGFSIRTLRNKLREYRQGAEATEAQAA